MANQVLTPGTTTRMTIGFFAGGSAQSSKNSWGLVFSGGGNVGGALGTATNGYEVSYAGAHTSGDSSVTVDVTIPSDASQQSGTEIIVYDGTASEYTVTVDVGPGGGSASSGNGYYYLTQLYPQGGGLSPQPASAFSQSAPLLLDNAKGDTSTGYAVTGTQSEQFAVYALIDQGARPGPVGSFEVAGVVGSGGGSFNDCTSYYSPDGVTWTQAGGPNLPGNQVGSSSTGTYTFSAPVTARYIQVGILGGANAGATLEMTDLRLYDPAGNPIGTAAPPARNRTTVTVF